jgi:hypothetical protein
MKLPVLTVSVLACAWMAFGADGKTEKQERTAVPASKQEGRPALPKVSSSDPSLSLYDSWSSFTVPPGGLQKLTSTSNYAGASTISVAIECPTGTSLQNISIAVWWGVPSANFLTLTDLIIGGEFVLANMGGGTVPVYGSQLMLEVVNAGSASVSCDQVTTFAVVH